VRPVALQADPEPLVADLLATLIDDTVGVGPPPTEWNVDTSDPYVGVFLDGTPEGVTFISQRATVRVVSFAKHTGTAKDLVLAAQAHLLAHAGGDGITSIQSLTGLLPGFDRDLKAEMASITVRVITRTSPS
jgi:hypothetical protein